MCLLLYFGCDVEVAAVTSPELSVSFVEPPRRAVAQWFSTRYVYFVSARGECSCAFPHVIAEEPIKYFDGIFDDEDDRDEDLASVRRLLDQIASCLSHVHSVELYPIWDGEETSPPKGHVDLSLAELQPETFLLTEQFLYRIHAGLNTVSQSSPVSFPRGDGH